MKIMMISFFIFGLAFIGMAIGVIFGGRKRCLRGSCGGLNQPGENSHCLCSGNNID
jgi:hypothetical protein